MKRTNSRLIHADCKASTVNVIIPINQNEIIIKMHNKNGMINSLKFTTVTVLDKFGNDITRSFPSEYVEQVGGNELIKLMVMINEQR